MESFYLDNFEKEVIFLYNINNTFYITLNNVNRFNNVSFLFIYIVYKCKRST